MNRLSCLHQDLSPSTPQSSCLERGLEIPEEILLEHLEHLQRTYSPHSGLPQVMVDKDTKEFFVV